MYHCSKSLLLLALLSCVACSRIGSCAKSKPGQKVIQRTIPLILSGADDAARVSIQVTSRTSARTQNLLKARPIQLRAIGPDGQVVNLSAKAFQPKTSHQRGVNAITGALDNVWAKMGLSAAGGFTGAQLSSLVNRALSEHAATHPEIEYDALNQEIIYRAPETGEVLTFSVRGAFEEQLRYDPATGRYINGAVTISTPQPIR